MTVEKITGVIKNYAWGSPGAIDIVRGLPPGSDIQAEWWLGDHPQGAAAIARGGEPLAEWLDSHGVHRVGFLLKILTPATPLSLQVHPTAPQAEAGYAREQALGIRPDAPERVFRDRSAKPELLVAVGGAFDALAGNASDDAVDRRIDRLVTAGFPPGWAQAWRDRLASSRAQTVAWLLAGEADAAELVSALGEVAHADSLLELLWSHYPGDPGCAVALMLNRVSLAPGEALFLDAGTPHAYLSGVGIELMAPSDNVLRGGLTPKHVDIGQLLDVASFDPTPVPRLEPIIHRECWREYAPPGQDFALHLFTVPEADSRVELSLSLPAIGVSIGAGATIAVDGEVVQLAQGEAAVVSAGDRLAQVTILPGSALWIAHRR